MEAFFLPIKKKKKKTRIQECVVNDSSVPCLMHLERANSWIFI